jgi:hypothetical protein
LAVALRRTLQRSTTDACLLRWRLRQKQLGVGLRRLCRGQACGGMLGAMARIARARPATLRSTAKFSLGRFPELRTSKTCYGVSRHQSVTSQSEARNFALAQQRLLLNPPPVVCDFCSKLRAPHRGTSLGPFVCAANNKFLKQIIIIRPAGSMQFNLHTVFKCALMYYRAIQDHEQMTFVW